jgi:DNA-binding ferritin-like protein (Dps family)
MKDDDTEISLNSKTVGEDKYVFKFQVKNNELTKSLQQILDLIESNSHLGIKNYHDFVNKFADLLIENEMDYIDSVHPEMLAAVLIRDEITGKRLDFSK